MNKLQYKTTNKNKRQTEIAPKYSINKMQSEYII